MSEPTDDSFHRLVERMRAGDQEAFRVIHDRFVRGLVEQAARTLNARTRAKVDPQEVVQSVWRTFFRRQAQGQFTLANWGGLWGLLVRITVNKCLNMNQHYERQCRAAASEIPCDAVAGQLLADGPTPEHPLLLLEALDEATRGLEERDRLIVDLRLQGYEKEEIAAEVGCAVRTVFRTLELVRKRLERRQAADAGR
jgi:DNA-directed RNA polymerase specialized sigma24 family protein